MAARAISSTSGSLNGMGKKDEACATIAEAGKKYSRIKPQSDRELKRISC